MDTHTALSRPQQEDERGTAASPFVKTGKTPAAPTVSRLEARR